MNLLSLMSGLGLILSASPFYCLNVSFIDSSIQDAMMSINGRSIMGRRIFLVSSIVFVLGHMIFGVLHRQACCSSNAVVETLYNMKHPALAIAVWRTALTCMFTKYMKPASRWYIIIASVVLDVAILVNIPTLPYFKRDKASTLARVWV